MLYLKKEKQKAKKKKKKKKNTEQGRPQYKLSFATNGCVHTFGFPGGSVVKNSPANAGDTGDSKTRMQIQPETASPYRRLVSDPQGPSFKLFSLNNSNFFHSPLSLAFEVRLLW